MRYSAAATIALLLFLFSACSPEEEQGITVHVAASMSDAVREIADAFTEQTGTEVQLNIASSGTLARQIVAGAPADVFISANTKWMDYITNEFGLIHQTRTQIAGNRLVVIVSVNSTGVPTSLEEIVDFSEECIALGDPSHVPAGEYAQEALERSEIWEEIRDYLVPALDVRAALAYVERGEVGLGIVYASDALLSEGVKTAFVIPATLHSPIIYEAAMPAGADPANGRAFLDYLNSRIAHEVFEKYGFIATSSEQ